MQILSNFARSTFLEQFSKPFMLKAFYHAPYCIITCYSVNNIATLRKTNYPERFPWRESRSIRHTRVFSTAFGSNIHALSL